MLHMTTIFIYIDPINSRHSCRYTYSMTIRRILGYGPGFISTYPYFIFDRSQLFVFVQHLKSSSCRLPRFSFFKPLPPRYAGDIKRHSYAGFVAQQVLKKKINCASLQEGIGEESLPLQKGSGKLT